MGTKVAVILRVYRGNGNKVNGKTVVVGTETMVMPWGWGR